METKDMILELRKKHGLSQDELAEKISGETEEEIRADAENLAKYTSARRQPTPKFSSESPEGQDTQKLAYREMLQSLNQK